MVSFEIDGLTHTLCGSGLWVKKDSNSLISVMLSLGDLFPLDNFGDFFPTHSSLNSMSLESEQLQLSVYEIMGLTHTSSETEQNETHKHGNTAG